MPQVAVQINGRTYRMACDEGQEAHLMELAQRFDRSIGELRGSFGEIGDQRLTVMAGVMVTDELSEANRKLRAAEDELTRLKDEVHKSAGPSAAALADTAARDVRLAEALTRTAERIEKLAGRLEKT